MSGRREGASNAARTRELLASRKLERVVVLGANGTMGYGSGALFTQAVPQVTFLARTRAKAEEGLGAAVKQVRSPTVASRATVGDYENDLEAAVGEADLVFEALTEDFAIKKDIFDRVEAARRDDAIVATVTSGLSINALGEGRSDSFRSHFLGLHFFNPPNVIVGTELIAGDDTDPAVVDFVEAFSRTQLGREMIRTKDTPAFAGNRVGFKVLNEAAQLALEHGPVLVDRLVGPYTGRALTPLATIDLVGWDIHRAIVDNVFEKTQDEAHATLELPAYMADLMEKGGGFQEQQIVGIQIVFVCEGIQEFGSQVGDMFSVPTQCQVASPIVSALQAIVYDHSPTLDPSASDAPANGIRSCAVPLKVMLSPAWLRLISAMPKLSRGTSLPSESRASMLPGAATIASEVASTETETTTEPATSVPSAARNTPSSKSTENPSAEARAGSPSLGCW